MIPSALRILLCTQPVDMRRSFDGLAELVVERLDEDPTSEGALFVFINARRDRAKLLWRDATGFCLLYKRLDVRLFAMPDGISPDATRVVLGPNALATLLDGVSEEPLQQPTSREVARAAKALVKARILKESPQPSA